ncbi:MAG: hypothetical protein CMJ87_13365 [Planctomycetes bacterium]|nr:hypothetical protein [Planctomycetota bacterium]
MIKPFTSIALLALAVLLPACKTTPSAGSGTGTAVPDPAPEAAFDAYMATMQANDWDAAATLMHPDALAELHETFIALARKDGAGEVARLFFDVQSAEEVAALTPAQGFVRLMAGLMALKPGMGQAFRDSTAQVIGTVPEGDVVHVLYRLEMNTSGRPISKLAVSPFRLHDGEWRALLTGELEGLIQALKGQDG